MTADACIHVELCHSYCLRELIRLWVWGRVVWNEEFSPAHWINGVNDSLWHLSDKCIYRLSRLCKKINKNSPKQAVDPQDTRTYSMQENTHTQVQRNISVRMPAFILTYTNIYECRCMCIDWMCVCSEYATKNTDTHIFYFVSIFCSGWIINLPVFLGVSIRMTHPSSNAGLLENQHTPIHTSTHPVINTNMLKHRHARTCTYTHIHTLPEKHKHKELPFSVFCQGCLSACTALLVRETPGR